MSIKRFLSVLAFGLLGAVGPASASLVYTFNANLGGGPFGTVTVTQGGSNIVNISVALNSGVGFVDTGINNFAFSVVTGIPLAAGNFSGFSTGWSFLGAPTNTDGAPANPAGFTQYALQCTTCGPGGSNPNPGPLNFTVTATGLLESSFSSLWIADICTAFSPGNGCSGATGATWTTGSSSSSSSSSSSTSGGGGGSGNVPEPSSSALALLGVALLGFTMLKRKLSHRA